MFFVVQIVYTLLNMTLFVRVISLKSFMFVSTAVVELLDLPIIVFCTSYSNHSTNICMYINITLAEIVCCLHIS